jgi:hypothetical protein
MAEPGPSLQSLPHGKGFPLRPLTRAACFFKPAVRPKALTAVGTFGQTAGTKMPVIGLQNVFMRKAMCRCSDSFSNKPPCSPACYPVCEEKNRNTKNNL